MSTFSVGGDVQTGRQRGAGGGADVPGGGGGVVVGDVVATVAVQVDLLETLASIAVRAAFKAVQDGTQVAVLVPTTLALCAFLLVTIFYKFDRSIP